MMTRVPRLVKMGFPARVEMNDGQVSRPFVFLLRAFPRLPRSPNTHCHRSPAIYLCPVCRFPSTTLPTQCPVCSLQLVSSPLLARPTATLCPCHHIARSPPTALANRTPARLPIATPHVVHTALPVLPRSRRRGYRQRRWRPLLGLGRARTPRAASSVRGAPDGSASTVT